MDGIVAGKIKIFLPIIFDTKLILIIKNYLNSLLRLKNTTTTVVQRWFQIDIFLQLLIVLMNMIQKCSLFYSEQRQFGAVDRKPWNIK